MKHVLLCIFIGALSAFGFAPFSFPPALILSYAWLFHHLLKTEKPSEGFRSAYFWALGHYIAGLYWIGNSTLVDAEAWWWAYPLASLVLPALFALYQAVAGYLSVKLPRYKLAQLPLMIGLFILAEYCRAYWFTGFPWNMAGATWISLPWIAQNADYMGMFGLGAVTMLCAGALANYREKASVAAITIMIVCMAAYGAIIEQPTAYDQNTTVRVVQPNIAQKIKWDSEHLYANSLAPVMQSDAPPASSPEKAIIIWPETAEAKTVWEHPEFRRLMLGALRDWPESTTLYSGLLQTDTGNMANSVIAADRNGKILWSADKHHLVPYGEYMPYDEVLKLGPIVGMEGFNKGAPPKTMTDGVIPLICYEIIFPDLARNARDTTSRMIITVTDDSWFGISSGPHQHLVQARFRAIETGLPVLRSANTGISAVIDPYGRLIQKTQMETYTSIENSLPLPRHNMPLYKLWDDLYTWLTLAICAILTIIKIFC